MFERIKHAYESFSDRVAGAVIGSKVGQESLMDMSNLAIVADTQLGQARESIADVSLAVDDIGWKQMNSDFARGLINQAELVKLVALSRMMYLLNPLIRRAVVVQELYVWGSGCRIKAKFKSKIVQEVLDDFFNAPKNQCAIGRSWDEREREQRIDGNTFFLFYTNKGNGAIRVRTVSITEILDVICNPEDRNEPWFYVRLKANGQSVLYPDINYTPKGKPAVYGDARIPIDWGVRVLHNKTGGITGMKFGIPELYSVLNWAVAYKGILENFATILKAYARIAWKLTGQKGEKGVAAAKSKLPATSITSENLIERNPPANTAAWMVMAGNADLSAVKTANSTTGPDEARALRSMVAAGSDTPEHFFGDSDIGNFATSTTLDRPTELKMISRQSMWEGVITTMVGLVLEASALAPNGKLRVAGYRAIVSQDPFDGSRTVMITPPSGQSTQVKTSFPPILERNVTERVRAVVQATTLGGSPAEGIIPDRRLVAQFLLEALGEKDADILLEDLYPESVIQGFIDPADKLENETKAADAKLLSAQASKTTAEKPTPTPVKQTVGV